jgi:protein SCO1/2
MLDYFRKSGLVFSIIAILVVIASSAISQVVKETVDELKMVDVEEHLGEYIPFDLTFIDDKGQTVQLGDYFNKSKPVLLTLGYYECPMLCNLILNGLTKTVKQMNWKPGIDYQIVTITINPNEDYKLAAAKKQTYVTALDEPSAQEGWSFLVGEESQSKKIADAVGFKFRYDEKIQQYAHPAALFLISEDGKITRYLYGIEFKANDMKLALMEASQGKIGNTIDKLILYCYHYDPDSQGYVVFAGNVMRLGGALTLIILVIFLGILFYRERQKKRLQLSGTNGI